VSLMLGGLTVRKGNPFPHRSDLWDLRKKGEGDGLDRLLIEDAVSGRRVLSKGNLEKSPNKNQEGSQSREKKKTEEET